MPKSLEAAIGCWTTATDWNVLTDLAELCKDSGRRCNRATKKGDAAKLMDELRLLKKRVVSLDELTESAINRLGNIMANNELAGG